MNKKKKAIAKEPKPIYHCRFCDKDKTDDKFFKCSIQHRSFICQDCIKEKYSELNARCEKHLAIFICCATLDIAFYWDIYRSLEIGQGIGYYVRHLNLLQNQNPDTFAEGVIKNNIIDYTPKDMKIDKATKGVKTYFIKLKAHQDKMRKFFGDCYNENNYICKFDNGKLFRPDYISHKFKTAISKSDLPMVRFHDLRHSAASFLIKSGCNLKEIQEWLGHSDIATTGNIYSHLEYSSKVSMAEKINKALDDNEC